MKYDLVQGNEKQHLIRLTVPLIWGILAIMTMNLVDTFFISQLGTNPLAAIGFTFPVVTILSSLAFGIGTGASSVIARAIGRGDHSKVCSYTTQSIILAFSIAVGFAIFGLVTIQPLFALLGATEELIPYISQYMGIWYLGCFLIVVPMVGNAAIRAGGNSKLPGIVMMVVALVNIILDPIFIFGLFGFPRLEIYGAALATIVAYSVTFCISLYVLQFKLHMFSTRGCFNNVLEGWKAILHVGIPAIGTNLITPLSIIITTWLVARYSTESVAGYAVVSRIEQLCLIVLMALSTAIAPFVGQNWGADKIDRVEKAISMSYKFSILFGVGVAIALLMIATPFLSLFSQDPEVINAARLYIYTVPITFGLLGIVMIASSVANGIGQPTPALIMSALRLIIIYLPAAFYLSKHWGLLGIFAATAIANLIVGLGAFFWSKSKCKSC